MTLGFKPRMCTSNMTTLSCLTTLLPPKDKRGPEHEVLKGKWPRGEVRERLHLELVQEEKRAKRSEWTPELILSNPGGISPGRVGGGVV